MRMERRDAQLLWALLLCFSSQVWSQFCTEPCRCPPARPRCPVGVPLVVDGCGCCQLCARQEGEACSELLPCDTHRGLQCDYSASLPGGPGQCIGRNELGCEVNGRRLEEGQVFQPSCAQLCRCLGGGLTCVPLCSHRLHRPHEKCPNPRLLRLPGRCCREWVCMGLDHRVYSSPPEAQRTLGGGLRSLSSFSPVSSDRNPCFSSCGPGFSARTKNKNRACRLQTEARRCQTRLPGLQRVQPRLPLCEGSFSSPVSGAHRARFCAGGRCCSPAHTRTVRMVVGCPRDRRSQQRSCLGSISSCLRSVLPQL